MLNFKLQPTIGGCLSTNMLLYGVGAFVGLVVGLSISEEVLLYGASLEQRITHPVARAIVRLAEERGITLLPRLDSKYHIGLGIEGVLDGKHFLLGSTRFMQKKENKDLPGNQRAGG